MYPLTVRSSCSCSCSSSFPLEYALLLYAVEYTTIVVLFTDFRVCRARGNYHVTMASYLLFCPYPLVPSELALHDDGVYTARPELHGLAGT